jgi:ubiquinone/menaquinone biosynthesis C-methylase UbiE
MTSISADARFWDRAARKYAKDPIKDMAGYERTLDRTRQYLVGTSVVLEIGCGTGTTALRLAPHVSRILATDVSGEMVEIAREKATAQGCTNIEFSVATPHDASWPESAVDAVLALNVLHLIAGRGAALSSLHRTLKPGGLLITKTPCLSEMNPLIRLAVPVMRAIGKAPYVDFFTAAELEREIEAAGYTIVERARHGSKGKDPRIFIVAQKS